MPQAFRWRHSPPHGACCSTLVFPSLQRRGGCAIKKDDAKLRLTAQTGWSPSPLQARCKFCLQVCHCCGGFCGGCPPPAPPPPRAPPGVPAPPPAPPRAPAGASAPGGAAAPGVPSLAKPPPLSGYLDRSCSPSMHAVSVCSYPVGRFRNPYGTLRLRRKVSTTVIDRVRAMGSSTSASYPMLFASLNVNRSTT